jgi:drug/metabolite transporter (DMT)-like permease
MAPMFTCLLAILMLGATVTLGQVRSLIAVFLSVVLIITGSEDTDNSSSPSLKTPSLVMGLVLLSQPILLASSQIALRQMRKMDHNTVTAYQNITLFVFALMVLVFEGENFTFLIALDFRSILILFLIGCVTTLHQNVKMIAFKNLEPSKL